MIVPATSLPPVTPPTWPPVGGSQTLTEGAGAPTGPIDSVSLSAAAQSLPADTAPPSPSPSRDELLAKAVSVLNDTSGEASIGDQLKAFNLIADSLRNGPAGDGQPTADLDAGAALIDSPVAQRMQQLLSYVSSQFDYAAWSDGTRHANSIDTALAAFDSLSSADQELLVGARALRQHQYKPQATGLIETVEDYRANQVARAGIERALQIAIADPRYAADTLFNASGGRNDFYSQRDALGKLAAAAGDQQMTDLVKLSQTDPESRVWTQSTQAYFAKYGPAPAGDPATIVAPSNFVGAPPASDGPGKAFMSAIATMNDTTGKVSSAEKYSAYQLASSFNARSSPLGALAGTLVWASPFAKHVDSLDAVMSRGVTRGSDAAQVQLDNLNRMSADDQAIVFSKANGAEGQRFASLATMKVNYAVRSDFNALLQTIEARFGTWNLSEIEDKSFTGSAGFSGLRDLLQQSDPFSDDWTRQAQSVLKAFADFDFGPDLKPGQTLDGDSARALDVLRQISADLRRQTEIYRERRQVDPPASGMGAWSQGRAAAGDRLDTSI